MLRLTDRRAALAAGPFRGPLPQASRAFFDGSPWRLVGLFVVVLEVAVFCGWDNDTFESSLETPCSEIQVVVHERGVFLLACLSYYFVDFLPSFVVLIVSRR